MTIEKTIGVLGDYADSGAAWTWLLTQDPLDDDYIFTVISDSTINLFPFAQVNTNGYDVLFTSNNKHYGDPTRGWQISLTNGVSQNYLGEGNGGSIKLEGLRFDRTAGATGAFVIMGNAGLGIATEYIIDDCLFQGRDNGITSIDTAIDIGRDSDTIKMFNCKIWNMRQGLSFNINTGSGGFKTQDKIFENIDIYDCRIGVFISTLFDFKVRMRNIVACDSIVNDWQDNGGNLSDWNVYNCADSDETLAGIGFNVNEDGVANVVASDEYKSLDDTDSNFLKKKKGSMVFGSGAWVYTPAALLGHAGKAPIYAGSTDIAGLPRPSESGNYAIGAEEQQYGGGPDDQPGGIQDLNIAINGTPNPGQAPVNVDFSATIEVPDRIEETDVLGVDRIVEDSDGSIRIVEV